MNGTQHKETGRDLDNADVVALLAREVGVPFERGDDIDVDLVAAAAVPESVARRHLIAPLRIRDGVLEVLQPDPYDVVATDELQHIVGYPTETICATRFDVLRMIERCYDALRREDGGTGGVADVHSAAPNGSTIATSDVKPFVSSDVNNVGSIEVSSGGRRLKTVIESAPVSLMLVTAKGEIVAANQAALRLIGVEQPGSLDGKELLAVVAEEHRAHVAMFVAAVCAGGIESLRYDVIGKGLRRTVETRAVPLRCDAATVCFGVTSEVSLAEVDSERQREDHQQLLARCDIAEATLREATRASTELSQRHDELAASVSAAQARLEAYSADAAHHRHLLAERAATIDQLRNEIDGLTTARAADAEQHDRLLAERDVTIGKLRAEIDGVAAARAAVAEQHHRVLTERATTIHKLRAEIAALTASRDADIDRQQQFFAERDAERQQLRAEILQLTGSRTTHIDQDRQVLAERDSEQKKLSPTIATAKQRLIDVHSAATQSLATAFAVERARYQVLLEETQRCRGVLEMTSELVKQAIDSVDYLFNTVDDHPPTEPVKTPDVGDKSLNADSTTSSEARRGMDERFEGSKSPL